MHDELTGITATTAPPVPGVTRNSGHTMQAVMPGHEAAPGMLQSWYVAAEDASRGQWVTWEGYRQDGEHDGQMAYATGMYFNTPDRARNKAAALRSVAARAGVKVVYPDPDYLDTPAKVFAQRTAELFWKAATCEDQVVSRSDRMVYRHLEQAFIATVQAAYGCSREIAWRVRDLLSEYGPDDSLRDTQGRGIYSYVQFARTHSRRDYHY